MCIWKDREDEWSDELEEQKGDTCVFDTFSD